MCFQLLRLPLPPLIAAFVLSATIGFADGWSYRDADVDIAIDTKATGQITRWTVGGKTLVDNPAPASPLSRIGETDRAAFVVQSATVLSPRSIQLTGSPNPGEPSAAQITLRYEIEEAGRRIVLTVDAPATTGPKGYQWNLPLRLNPRKRIFYLSDHELPWDTRYFHQMTFQPRSTASHPSLLPVPDRNEWRHFSLDQLSPNAYRLWKSEAADTAPLVMHEGRAPAPAVQLYDEQGGVMAEYPNFRDNTPASIRVDASGGGRIEVGFRAGDTIILTAQTSEQDALAAQAGLADRYRETFTPLPLADAILEEAPAIVNAPVTDNIHVTGGYSFAQGTLHDAGHVRIEINGAPVPVQTKSLARWPDGSIKWVLLSFPADASRAVAECPAPRVSLRNGKFLPVNISIAKAALAPSPGITVEKNSSDEVRVLNGGLEVTLAKGEHWLRRVVWQGVPLVDSSVPNLAATAYCEFLLNPGEVFPFDTAPRGGKPDRGTLRIDRVSVRESGPLRSVIHLEGLTTNQEPTRILLELEFIKDRPEIRITHTTVFRFKDPRRTFLTGLGLDLPLHAALLSADARGTTQLRQPTALLREKKTGDTLLVEDSDRPGALRVGGAQAGMMAAIRNFKELAPKALTADHDRRRLRIELWPHDSAPMDVRRYSNYAHVAQLESAPAQQEDWVEKGFYTTDPFFGVSRSHEILLTFDQGQENAPAAAESAAADFQSPPLLYAGWGHYAGTEILLPSSTQEEAPRSWESWTRITRFFLYHRELHAWYGFWNYGDIRHRFRRGYGWTHPAEVLGRLVDGTLKDEPSVRNLRQLDYWPPNDWNYDNGAYGWTNTEGLPGLFLQHEYLRHGNRVVYFAAEAMARHARDVVIRQEGRWLGKGTRHGVQPWSDGNHEERQTTSTEYRLHYLLSGEGRTRDVVENLYRDVYTQDLVDRDASHSGRLGGLLFHWELTGDAEEARRLRRYMHAFVSEKGIHVSPSVNFPSAETTAAAPGLNSSSLFFHVFGAMHALIEYAQLTGDSQVNDALLKMASSLIRRPIVEKEILGRSEFTWAALAYAARHAPDPAPYRDLLGRYMEAYGWQNAYQPVTENPAHWSGPSGLMRVGVSHYFFWANWAPYVTQVLDGPEIWTPQIARDYAATEKRGSTFRPARLDWQSAYDAIPALDSYLGTQQPWRLQPSGKSK